MSLRIAGGAVFFNPKVNGVLQGQIKFGSTQGFPLTATSTKLPSYNNDDSGIGVKEADVVIRKEYSGNAPLRNLTMDIIALVFGADAVTTRSQSSGTLNETLTGVKQGRYYQLGVTASFPTGARGLSSETVEVSSVAKTGYTLDADLGRIYIVPGGDIADGDDVDVTATLAAVDWESVISGDAEAVGEMQVIGKTATGDIVDHFFPSVSLALDGEYQVKGDPENPAFVQLPLGITILEDTDGGRAAIYIDGRPAA